jgi:adenylate cyclase
MMTFRGHFFLLKYSMLKQILTSPWTALVTLAVVVGIRIWDPAFVESVRLRYFDTMVTSKPAEVTGVHVVNIDEKAVEKYGQFPFPRHVYAGIIRDLYNRNAGLVVFNVLTPDRDRMGGDSSYVAALQKYPTVLPSLGSTQSRNEPRTPGTVTIGPFGLDTFVTYPGIIANTPAVESAAAGVGIVNTLPEGFAGELIMIARLFFVTAVSSMACVIAQSGGFSLTYLSAQPTANKVEA